MNEDDKNFWDAINEAKESATYKQTMELLELINFIESINNPTKKYIWTDKGTSG